MFTSKHPVTAMSRSTAVRLPDETYARLKTLASHTGRTTTYYIREAIDKYLEDLEDIYLAEKALEELRAGRSRTYTLKEVEQDLGLAD